MRALLLGSVAALAALAPLTPASAHAAYRSSDPADGARVGSPPSQVVAEFTEPVTADSYIEVVDPCGEVVSGPSRPFNDTITASMNGTRSGTYVVNFSVLSALDGHGTDGSFSFSSTGGDACPGSEPPPREEPPGGNNGNDPDPGPGGSGDPGTSTDPGSTSAEGPSTSNTEPSGTSNQGGEAGRRGGRGERGRVSRTGTGGERINVAQNADRKKQKNIWDDIPVNALVVGLTISALIGAAGGRIYAGIMGPRRL